MTTWWDEKATRLQRGVRKDEFGNKDHSEEEVRRAAVCAREDIVLLVSYLSTAIYFLSSIRRWLIALTIVAIIICFRLNH